MRKRVFVLTVLLQVCLAVASAWAQSVVAVVPMALSPESVAVDSVHNRIFVGQNDSFGLPGFEVAVMDGVTNTVIARIPISGEPGEWGIDINEAIGRVYVANNFGVVVIDTASLAIVDTISLPTGVTTVAVNRVTNRIYANSTIEIFAIDGATDAVVGTAFLSRLPRQLAVDTVHDRVFVTHEGAGFVSVVDGSTLSITTFPVAGRLIPAAVDPLLGHFYAADAPVSGPTTLFVYDTASFASLATIPSRPRCEGVAVDPTTHRVYAGSGDFQTGFTVVDGSTLAPITVVSTTHLTAREVAVNAVTHRIYLPSGEVEPQGVVTVAEDLPPDADLSLTASSTSATTGTNAMLTFTAANAGPADASAVTLAVTLGSGLSFVSCTASDGGTCSAGGAAWSSLAAGASHTLTIVATVDCSVADGAVLASPASLTSSTPDPSAANNSATATVTASNPAPVLTCPANVTATLPLNASSMPVSYSTPAATDNCPAVSVLCSPPSGSLFGAGTTTVTCTATDSGGRQTSCSFSLTVQTPQQATASIAASVAALPVSSGQAGSLTAKLNAAISQLDNGHVNAARNQLQAFINEVASMIANGVITAAEGQPLIDAANALLATLA